MPLYRERVYGYYGFDNAAGKWTRCRSRDAASTTTRSAPSRRRSPAQGRAQAGRPRQRSRIRGPRKPPKTAKDLKGQIDSEKDPAKKAELENSSRRRLDKNREALEEVVRRAHPSLEVVDRAKNITRSNSWSRSPTPTRPSASTAPRRRSTAARSKGYWISLHRALPRITRPTRCRRRTRTPPTAKITSSAALGGTGAQGGVNPFPGDVDMSESIKIIAPTADAARSRSPRPSRRP